jgi:hypothetical protein
MVRHAQSIQECIIHLIRSERWIPGTGQRTRKSKYFLHGADNVHLMRIAQTHERLRDARLGQHQDDAFNAADCRKQGATTPEMRSSLLGSRFREIAGP